jgi:hypothetical protein
MELVYSTGQIANHLSDSSGATSSTTGFLNKFALGRGWQQQFTASIGGGAVVGRGASW